MFCIINGSKKQANFNNKTLDEAPYNKVSFILLVIPMPFIYLFMKCRLGNMHLTDGIFPLYHRKLHQGKSSIISAAGFFREK